MLRAEWEAGIDSCFPRLFSLLQKGRKTRKCRGNPWRDKGFGHFSPVFSQSFPPIFSPTILALSPAFSCLFPCSSADFNCFFDPDSARSELDFYPFLITTLIAGKNWDDGGEKAEKPWGCKREWQWGKDDMGEMTIFDSDIVGIVKAIFGLDVESNFSHLKA